MFDFSKSIFNSGLTPSIPSDAQIIFVADLFAEEYAGGAELTTQGLIQTSPFNVFKLKSKDVTLDLLKQGSKQFWIFGNFANLNPQLIPSIVGNLRYSILEYDFKFCRYRSPDKHQFETKSPCDCDSQINGKVISAFMYGSMGLWWMSENQRDQVFKRFPFLSEKDNIILSSIFPQETLGKLKFLRETRSNTPVDELGPWIILNSPSWIKGSQSAIQWCKDTNKDYELIWNLPYDELLVKLSTSKGFVCLPSGGDTCPRMVIEAKLLGCELHTNEHVLHASEEWFDTDDLNLTESYLFAAPNLFWNGIKKMMNYKPSISGYTTTYNCVKQTYPFIQCIKSMLEFCDEVCVVDGGSSDETLGDLASLAYPQASIAQTVDFEVLSSLWANSNDGNYEFPDEYQGIKKDPRIKVKVVYRNWDHPRFAVFDGAQKAEARAMCTKEFCWQMDADEIVHEEDAPKILELARNMPKNVPLIALPVIEYWGSVEKVRMDITPWKWRISRNLPYITHGIPISLRKTDENGDLYALEGTDGCDIIHNETGEPIPFVNFYTVDVDNARRVAMLGNQQAHEGYEIWFNQVINQLPSVFHYSWLNIPCKIRRYRDYWTKHWNSLYNKSLEDTAQSNMMFDIPWSDVTEEMIASRGDELANKLGGWIWHKKWNGITVTPHIKISRTQPKIML